jgi:hypothetical protein
VSACTPLAVGVDVGIESLFKEDVEISVTAAIGENERKP